MWKEEIWRSEWWKRMEDNERGKGGREVSLALGLEALRLDNGGTEEKGVVD